MINRYFTIANLLLITAGAYLGVTTFYTMVTARLDYGAPAGAATTRGVSPPPAEFSRAPLAEYSAITQRNIFNSSDDKITPAEVPEKVDIDKLKQTDMKLKLWGTVTGQDDRAYAVIEDTKAREQNLYRAGDAIQNAVVKIILREKVVLRVDDRDEVLAMEEIRETGGASRSVPRCRPRPRSCRYQTTHAKSGCRGLKLKKRWKIWVNSWSRQPCDRISSTASPPEFRSPE